MKIHPLLLIILISPFTIFAQQNTEKKSGLPQDDTIGRSTIREQGRFPIPLSRMIRVTQSEIAFDSESRTATAVLYNPFSSSQKAHITIALYPPPQARSANDFAAKLIQDSVKATDSTSEEFTAEDSTNSVDLTHTLPAWITGFPIDTILLLQGKEKKEIRLRLTLPPDLPSGEYIAYLIVSTQHFQAEPEIGQSLAAAISQQVGKPMKPSKDFGFTFDLPEFAQPRSIAKLRFVHTASVP
jgi:hypothetical protein